MASTNALQLVTHEKPRLPHPVLQLLCPTKPVSGYGFLRGTFRARIGVRLASGRVNRAVPILEHLSSCGQRHTICHKGGLGKAPPDKGFQITAAEAIDKVRETRRANRRRLDVMYYFRTETNVIW